MSPSAKKNIQNQSLSLFDDAPRLTIIQAHFERIHESSFKDLLQGYQRMRILTYSTSLALIKDVAEKMDDLEIIFGREDILHRVSQYVAYQDLLLRDLKQEFHDHDVARQKIDAGTLRMFIVRDMISHEKLYLLEGDAGKRVITGSANFSERAISGKQNESFVCFDNDDDAWEFFT